MSKVADMAWNSARWIEFRFEQKDAKKHRVEVPASKGIR